MFFVLVGVVTFCRNSATPLAAEEGVTGVLSTERSDAVKCYGEMNERTSEDVSRIGSHTHTLTHVRAHTVDLGF